ncbi:MAG: DUF2878 domain-containing protein [Planctomycetes bacterium]|nr:DUF2878 domain-containing protein [Planctomycetota bacterium]
MPAGILINFALFQATWLASVLGAANGSPLLGPIVAAFALSIHVAMSSHRFPEARLILSCALLGFSCDTTLAFLGLVRFESHWPTSWPCPLWMLAPWVGFSLTFNGCFSWLKGRPGLAAAFGALGGPAAYWAAARMGAIHAHDTPIVTYVAVAFEYALLVPLMMRLASLCVTRRHAGDACSRTAAPKGAA